MKDLLMTLPYHGKGRLCPVCGKTSRQFREFGLPPREGAQCAFCGSLERHRFSWLFIIMKTNLFDDEPKRMLHVAPEPCFEKRFGKHLGEMYLSVDLNNPYAAEKMDITQIKYPDESFDIIYCSHVLEHVQDDKKAMSEFYRILKCSGWAILLVPITAEKTFEDPSIVDANMRKMVFGQEDHVRRYGPDYIDRLRSIGFHVEVSEVSDLVPDDEVEKMGLSSASGEIYLCSKQGFDV